MKKIVFKLLVASIVVGTVACKKTNVRQIIDCNFGWQFYLGDGAEVEFTAANFDDTLLASAAGYITAKVNLGSLKTDVGDVALMQAGDSESIIIAIDTDSPGENLGAAKVEEALKAQGKNPVVVSLSTAGGQEHIRVQKTNGDPQIKKEGYRLKNEDGKWVISAQDIAGSIYGLMDLAEQIQIKKGLDKVTAKLENPKLALRAVKFNIPWSSYRRNKAMQSNEEICKDLKFWEGFLNMMVENRLNALSLWNMHPFPYMIRTKNFPKATPFTNQELAEYQHLYKSIFKMAKDRGIETYQMTWNIFVSEAFIQNYGPGRDDLGKFKADAVNSKQIEQYLRESMIQLIEEYPNLTGIGMALGEGMDDYNIKQQEQFAEEVFFRAVREANRKVKFIYRRALSESHAGHREIVERANIDTKDNPMILEYKFNGSHGHSVPERLFTNEAGLGKEYWTPTPTKHKMAWTIRNEDFFRLRWGEPGFIREHIKLNSQDYVAGYFIGSESYIPALDFFHKTGHNHVNWKYAYERQWLYYMQWGRLLYNPETSNDVFANAFNQRFAGDHGDKLVEAYELSTRATQKLLAFFSWSWDFTSYTEGFMDRKSMRTVEMAINSNPTDPDLVSVKEYGNGDGNFGNKITPVEHADILVKDSERALSLVGGITTSNNTLKCEMDDVKAWSYLGLYFAKVLRTAVALNQNKKSEAVSHMEEGVQHWRDLVTVTDAHIKPSYLPHIKGDFHWKNLQSSVDGELQWVKKQLNQ